MIKGLPKERLVRERIGAVCVHHERHVRVALSHPPYDIDIPARLNLDLDPSVATGEFGSDLLKKLFHRVLNTDRHSGGGAGAGSAESGSERFVCLAGESVPDRHLDGGLCHVVAAHA